MNVHSLIGLPINKICLTLRANYYSIFAHRNLHHKFSRTEYREWKVHTKIVHTPVSRSHDGSPHTETTLVKSLHYRYICSNLKMPSLFPPYRLFVPSHSWSPEMGNKHQIFFSCLQSNSTKPMNNHSCRIWTRSPVQRWWGFEGGMILHQP